MNSRRPFAFRRFTVRQDRCAMPVGTDGVLLGAWTAALLRSLGAGAASLHCLDVGTGTGLIALMLAQALPQAVVEAVEIDPDAAAQAVQNVAASPWPDRIRVHALALDGYDSRLPAAPAGTAPGTATERDAAGAAFDLIVSNPPFYDATLKPADAARAMARHNDALTWDALMRFAARRLTPGGLLSLVCPTAALGDVFAAATLAGLAPSHLTDVTTRLASPPKRTLAAFGRHAGAVERTRLDLRDAEGRYTDAYRALTADYYLTLR